MDKRLKQRIDAIPDEEGWYKGEPKAFYKIAKVLGNMDFTEDEIVNLLENAYWEVAELFGL